MLFKDSLTHSRSDLLPFVARDREILSGCTFLEATHAINEGSRLLLVEGDSGTGKTTYYKSLLTKSLTSYDEPVCLVLDIRDDNLKANEIFEMLLYLAWNARSGIQKDLINIPKKRNASYFFNRQSIPAKGLVFIYELLTKTMGLLPAAPSIKNILPEKGRSLSGIPGSPSTADAFFSYLSYVAKKGPVFIAIDNYQFLPDALRILFEARAGSITENLNLMIVNRTVDGRSEIARPACFQDSCLHIELKVFDQNQVRQLLAADIERQYGISVKDRILEKLSGDCYIKTGGNLKEIEFYIRSFRDKFKSSSTSLPVSETFLETISRLPDMARRLISLAALFPGGIKIQHAMGVLQQIDFSIEASDFVKMLGELSNLGYLVVNSEKGEMIRPAHEKIVTTIKSILGDKDVLIIREASIVALENVMSSSTSSRSEDSYILHCLVGILTFEETLKRLDKFLLLVDMQYSADRFYYLLSLYEAFPDILEYLPENTIAAFLDSFQKTTEFYKGLAALQRLERERTDMEYTINLYRAKYYTQIYKYRDALDVLDKLPKSQTTDLYRLISLQSLGHDKESRLLIDEVKTSTERSDAYYVIMRNSAHYFAFEDARDILKEVIEHYKVRRQTFELATSFNNLGVVYIWHKDLEDAERNLKSAAEIYSSIASCEIFSVWVNLGIIKSLNSEGHEAAKLFELAKPLILKNLIWDHVSLETNILINRIFNLGEDSCDVVESFRGFLTSIQHIDDPHLQDLADFNLSAARYLFGDLLEAPIFPERFQLPGSDFGSGYECSVKIEKFGRTSEFIYMLFPQWRH